MLVERSFCGQDADRHGGPGRGEGWGRASVRCGSSLTGCGRHTGPRLPCPPHGEHAPIGVRQYRARSFFASAAPAPLPRSLFDQHESSVLAHPPRSTPSGTSPIDQPARCSRSMITMASPRSSAGERFARGMTPLAPQTLPSIGAPVDFPGGLAQVSGEFTPRTVDRLNNRHGGAGRAHRWGLSPRSSRIEPPCPTLNSFRCLDGHLHRNTAAPRSREPLTPTYHSTQSPLNPSPSVLSRMAQASTRTTGSCKETADWLSRLEEPDIDQLVPRAERAI